MPPSPSPRPRRHRDRRRPGLAILQHRAARRCRSIHQSQNITVRCRRSPATGGFPTRRHVGEVRVPAREAALPACCRASRSHVAFYADDRGGHPVLQVLIGQIGQDREINRFRQTLRVLRDPSFSSQSAICCIAALPTRTRASGVYPINSQRSRPLEPGQTILGAKF